MKTTKNRRIIKKPRENLPVAELYAMRFTFLIGAGVMAIVGIIYSAVTKTFDYRIFSGIIAGVIISGANFYLLAHSNVSVLQGRNPAKARSSATIWYVARYIGMAAVYAFLFTYDLVNIFTALLPLFFPKIHYTFTIIKNKS